LKKLAKLADTCSHAFFAYSRIVLGKDLREVAIPFKAARREQKRKKELAAFFAYSRSQTDFEDMRVHIPRISKLIEMFICFDELWPDHLETRRVRFRPPNQVIDDDATFGKPFEMIRSKDLKCLRA
jgi:hypothetical protein